MSRKPSALLVCIHNAGRSQMTAGFPSALAGDASEVRSAVSAPADAVNPAAVQASDVVITMGFGDICPFFPGKRYRDWVLDDPAGKGVEAVRPIRDQTKARVEDLIVELLPDTATH